MVKYYLFHVGFSNFNFMEEDIEIIDPPKISYKKVIAVFFTAVLFFLVIFFSSKAYNLTKKVIVARSSNASPYLAQDIDFISNIEIGSVIKEEDRRINILLLGMGGKEHEGPNLTDTIMVASIDPLNKEVAMLSIPRDLYVDIGDWGAYKINSAYNLAESYYKEEGNKFTLIKDLVGDVIGAPIHYFVLVDFDGFVNIIDILGGIEIYVEENLYDPFYPDEDMIGYDELFIEKGIHLMNGETALKYARSRQTTSDFDRTRRQQEILIAVKNKSLEKQNVFNIRKISQIIDALSDNIKTDLQITEMEELIKIVKNIENSKISIEIMDDDIGGLLYADKKDDLYILLPQESDFSNIHDFVKQYFKDPLIIQENARIAIRNGTNINGLAKKLTDELVSFGHNVVDFSNSEKRDYPETFIYDYSNGSKKFTVDFLRERLGNVPVVKLDDVGAEFDIEIIIGGDYKL